MGGFTRIFSPPKPQVPAYTPPPVTQPPVVTDPSVQQAADAARTAQASAAGRASTILTSGLGDKTQATVNKKTLLGG